mgnify:CR=1 FL=1
MKQFLKKDKKFLSTKDYIVSNETYNLYLDLKTKIVWTEINKQQNLNKYYKNIYIRNHNNKLSYIFLSLSLMISIISQIGISISNSESKLAIHIVELVLLFIMIDKNP